MHMQKLIATVINFSLIYANLGLKGLDGCILPIVWHYCFWSKHNLLLLSNTYRAVFKLPPVVTTISVMYYVILL